MERSINPLIISLKGVPIVVPIIARPAGRLDLRAAAHRLRPARLRGRRQHRGGPPGRHQRRPDPHLGLRDLLAPWPPIGGIVAASRASSVDPNTGGSNVLLYAVGAAVIGGTSLFGGKGRVLDAVLGGAVVAVIDNGMGLMGYSSGVKFVVTGLVLLLAASVDALSRRTSGRHRTPMTPSWHESDGSTDARRARARRRSAGRTSARCCATCTCTARSRAPSSPPRSGSTAARSAR